MVLLSQCTRVRRDHLFHPVGSTAHLIVRLKIDGTTFFPTNAQSGSISGDSSLWHIRRTLCLAIFLSLIVSSDIYLYIVFWISPCRLIDVHVCTHHHTCSLSMYLTSHPRSRNTSNSLNHRYKTALGGLHQLHRHGVLCALPQVNSCTSTNSYVGGVIVRDAHTLLRRLFKSVHTGCTNVRQQMASYAFMVRIDSILPTRR